MSLKISTEQRGPDLFFQFAGAMDERTGLPALPEPLPARLIVDLSGVNLINSLGCRNWVNWVKPFEKGGRLELEKCPPPVVNQANILVGFLPPFAEVTSFFVPYFCEPCEHEEFVLVQAGKDYGPGQKLSMSPTRSCPKCGEVTELDVMPERYFKFLDKK